jgi:hypothetical protein
LVGIGVIDERVFAYDNHFLYWFVDGRLERDKDVAEASGVPSPYGTQFTHGNITLSNGRRILLWDGDGYEFTNGQLKRTWPLRINDEHEFMAVPWGQDGIYFLEQRKVYRVKRAAKREQVMTAVENIMGIGAGPDGSIRFHLGTNDKAIHAGLWFPTDDTYIPLETRAISARKTSIELAGIHWSHETRHFYVVARDGIFTIPDGAVLKRPREKMPQ